MVIKMKKRSLFFAISALLATAFIFYNSMQPATESSASSSLFVDFVMERLSKLNINPDTDTLTFFVRKAAHITEFFLQGMLISLAYLFGNHKFSSRMVYIMFFGLLTACTDELLQHFVSGRADLVIDIWIDFSGGLIAVLLCFFISVLYEKK